MNNDDYNYYGDGRVMAGCERRCIERYIKGYDEERMIVTIQLWDDEPYEAPFEYQVCPTCRGKGSHVNPSIDAHGISGEQFAEDPEFAEEYWSGRFDVTCYGCKGKRVVPHVTDEQYLDALRGDYEDEQYRLAELRAGC